MKKIGILNSSISRVISELGHKDTIVICDCGLPIPPQTNRIDLALKQGVPTFLSTLETVATEMQIEAVYVAEESDGGSPRLSELIEGVLPGIPILRISHEELKNRSKDAKGIIRTGECTPYYNVILEAGVFF